MQLLALSVANFNFVAILLLCLLPRMNSDDSSEAGYGMDNPYLMLANLTDCHSRPGVKCRKNAKPKPLNTVFYVHEDANLETFFNCLLDTLKDNSIGFECYENGDLYANFEAEYSIPCTNIKNVAIHSADDYLSLMEHAVKKAHPEVKLTVTEIKVTLDDEEDTDGEAEEESERSRKRPKKNEPTPEEVEQTENIVKLKTLYQCEDRSCPYDICWPHSTLKKHINLTHTHFLEWASLMNKDTSDSAIDFKNPPHSKCFNPIWMNPDDRLVHHCHALTSTTNEVQGGHHHFTFNIEGLTVNPTRVIPGPNPPAGAPIARNFMACPKIFLYQFVKHYDLSNTIFEKLMNFKVTEPHALAYLLKGNLQAEGKLSLPQIADVRYAQECWLAKDPPLELNIWED
ncbi:hypothetical protein BDN71DRAFT_1429353 [Pleurotus eryngii]|uniref:C2H2-type domain-containing protein n=1 Tax=Pleurotus eryngii TaxID=5323 RepID=A0A9P6A1Q6_PLEER|nr:hypothetical protein BDN71DRAFT_1429353 [Pleurotus eryngii]